jgi:hypothetical protein
MAYGVGPSSSTSSGSMSSDASILAGTSRSMVKDSEPMMIDSINHSLQSWTYSIGYCWNKAPFGSTPSMVRKPAASHHTFQAEPGAPGQTWLRKNGLIM